MKRIRLHLSFANIAALLALVVAVSGTSAYAATLITSRQIKNGTIRNIDIHNGTIKGNKISSGTIGVGNLSPSARSDVVYTALPNQGLWTANLDYGLMSLSIPGPGNYLITAVVTLTNQDTGAGHTVTCTLNSNDAGLQQVPTILGPASGPGNQQSVTLILPHVYAAAIAATFDCTSAGAYSSGNVVQADNMILWAQRVDSLTE